MSDSNDQKLNGTSNGTFFWSEDREPVEELAEDFAQRLRNGERASIDEYCNRFPDLEEEIRAVFPAVMTMERLNRRKQLTNGKKVDSPDLPIERLGDFRVIHEIARGGMGIVYEAEQVSLGRHVAVKVLPKHALRSERDVQRFQREAQTSAKLHHTNIVPVFGVGQQDEMHYIVMQLIRGVGLDEVLTQLRQIVISKSAHSNKPETPRSTRIKRNADVLLKGELRRDASHATTSVHGHGDTLESKTPAESDAPSSNSDPANQQLKKMVVDMESHGLQSKTYFRNVALIGFQAANALSHAHQHNILHRDVKPGNLLLDDGGVVWMADFGIAKALEQNDVTCTGDLVGTVCYMAPERFEGTTNALCDIYSLGLTLYELLTLSRAFDGSDRMSIVHQLTHNQIPQPRKVNPAIPRDLETIVLKAAAKNPQDRYENAAQLASDLDAYLNDRPIQARRIGYAEHFVRWCRNNKAVASLAASVMVLLVTVFAVTSIGYVRESFQRKRAESTAQLAVEALDEIYGQFAPRQLRAFDSDSSEANDDVDFITNQGQLPLSNDVAVLLENLLKFYDDLSQKSTDHREFALKSTRANRRVGDIQHRLGELDKAQAAYERAIDRIQQLTATVGPSDALDLEFARTQNGLGMVLEDKRQRDAAIVAHRKARDRLSQGADQNAIRYELARTLYLLQLAELDRSRHRNKHGKKDSPTEQHNAKAIEILIELAEKDRDNPDYQFLLAKCYLAKTSRRHRSRQDQDKHAFNAIEILEQLVACWPNAPDYQYELGDAYWHIVFPTIFQGRAKRDQDPTPDTLELAEIRLVRALEVTADLELNHPNIPEYLQLKARLHHLYAKVLKDQKRYLEAEKQYERGIEKQLLVVRQSRSPIRHEVWRMHMELHRVNLQRDMGKTQEARRNLEMIVNESSQLLQNEEVQKHSRTRRLADEALTKSRVALSCILRKEGEEDQADELLRKVENPQ